MPKCRFASQTLELKFCIDDYQNILLARANLPSKPLKLATYEIIFLCELKKGIKIEQTHEAVPIERKIFRNFCINSAQLNDFSSVSLNETLIG